MTPVRLGLGANNVYVIRGESGAVCIDAGPDYEGSWEELTRQLARHGLRPADVRVVVLTHAHLDHAGLGARWQQAGARVYAGRGDEASLVRGEEERRRLRAMATALLAAHGVPEEAVRESAPMRALGRQTDDEGEWPAPLRMTPLAPDRLLDDGDRVTDGGVALRIVACPGHTPGTVLIHDERDGHVYTGDHILPRMVATVGIQFRHGERWPSMPPFVRSLQRASALGGGDVSMPALPGHGDALPDLLRASDWSLRYAERRIERARRKLTDGPATAYDLARGMFRHLRPRHIWPVMAEMIGLLDLLVERGEARADEAGGRTVYRTSPPGSLPEAGRER